MVLLRSLLYLQEVAKTQSINKAAENLYISKSALSTAIKNLEQEFGVPLLNRSVQGVTLTDAGEMVVERASLIFNILNGMKEECRNYNDARHEINFFMEDRFSNSVFPHIMVELKDMQPNTYITAQSVTAFEEIFARVAEDKDNVGLFLESGWDGHPPETVDASLYQNVVFRHIDSYEICVVTSKYSKHVPMNVTSLTYEELRRIPQVELMSGSRTYNSWANSEMAPDQNYVMSTDNNNIYFQAILNDFGVGQMLKTAIPYGLTDRNKLRFISLENAEHASLWLICNKQMDPVRVERLSKAIKHAMNAQQS